MYVSRYLLLVNIVLISKLVATNYNMFVRMYVCMYVCMYVYVFRRVPHVRFFEFSQEALLPRVR